MTATLPGPRLQDMRERRTTLLTTVLVLAFVALLVAPLAASASSGLPSTVTMYPETAGPGTTVELTGLDFPGDAIVEVELTGAQVVEAIEDDFIMAGISTVGGYFHSDGSELQMDSVYHVLTTDFQYGQDTYKFKLFDSTPKTTDLLYSDPTLIYLETLGTSPDKPLDQFLDLDPRR